MVACDQCGTRVSATGYLGGPIVCHECARENRREIEHEEAQ